MWKLTDEWLNNEKPANHFAIQYELSAIIHTSLQQKYDLVDHT